MKFSWERQHILLTGASGFLGCNMRNLLDARNLDFVGPAHDEYNLTDVEDCHCLFELYQPTAVIHLAGLVGGIGANTARPADFFHENILMGVNVLETARRSRVEKLVAASAGCGYPEHAPIPLKEESLWDGFPQPWSAPYSLAKRMLTVQAKAMYQQYGFNSVVGMPGNIYGPHDNFNLEDGHVIAAMVRKYVEAVKFGQDEVVLWGDGNSTRDFVYAMDVCEGLLHIAEVTDGEPQLVNLSSGGEHSIREVAVMISDLTGFRGKTKWDTSKPNGQRRRCFDTSKAKELGWTAKTKLSDGLELTVNWFRENYDSARK